MQYEFKVAKVKCQGCVRAICDGLGQLPGVQQVAVEVTTGQVTVSAVAPCTMAELTRRLATLGYPIRA